MISAIFLNSEALRFGSGCLQHGRVFDGVLAMLNYLKVFTGL